MKSFITNVKVDSYFLNNMCYNFIICRIKKLLYTIIFTECINGKTVIMCVVNTKV